MGSCFCGRVTSAPARVYLIADEKTRLCLLIDGLLEFPLVLLTLYSHHSNLSLDQVAENTRTLNISYVGATGE